MKKSRLSLSWAPLAALLSLPQLHAAVNITEPPTVYDFPAVPAVADFSTLSVGTGIDGTILDNAAFDAKIIAAANATAIITTLGSSGTFPPSTNAIARFNTGANANGTTFLQTRPTGNDYVLLMATVANGTAAPLSTVTVSYDYSKATDTASETIKGFRAFWSLTGTPGSWQPIPALSKDTTGTFDAPEAVNAVISLPAPLAPGASFYMIWADQNSSGTDASYHLDNFRVAPGGAPSCSINGSAAPGTRSPGSNLADPSDDTVSFAATITGTGPLSPLGWITTAPAGLAGLITGPYGSAHNVAGVPVANAENGLMRVTVRDAADANCTTTFNVRTPVVFGTNEALTPARTVVSSAPIPTAWVADEPARTLRQSNATQANHIVLSEEFTMPGGGKAVELSAKLVAEAGASSGFEAADSFALDLIIDGVVVSALGAADVNGDGLLTGAATDGLELPDVTQINTTKEFLFNAVVPATASKVQVRITGNSNSPAETFVVSDVKFSIPGPSIAVRTAGAPFLDNRGTDTPDDDGFSAPFTVNAVNFTGVSWISNDSPPRTGPYSPPNVVFGPYPIANGPRQVSLSDQANPAIVSQTFTVNLPAAPTLTLSAPNNITQNSDGSVSFDAIVNGANGGPRFSVSGATASRNTYGTAPVRFTIPAGFAPFSVTISDVSYPEVNQTTLINAPIEFVIGQTNFGALQDLTTVASDAPWANDFLARTTTINAGTATDAVVASRIIDLSTVGAVSFSAKFNVADTSAGSNMEVTDRFRAELIIDAGLPSQQIVNLVDQWDKGNGASATAVLTGGANGPKDGYINGYSGTAALDLISLIDYAIPPLVAEDEYNANRERDEFNIRNEIADVSINNDFALSHAIPAAANSVQFRFMAQGINGSESGTVSEVLFSAAAGSSDNDGDGVSNTDEAIMGTDPNNANDVLRIAQNAANPSLMTFPTKAGRFYRLYVSDDASAPGHLQSWKDSGLATIVGNGNSGSFTVIPNPGVTRRFYRLHVMESNGPWAPTRP